MNQINYLKKLICKTETEMRLVSLNEILYCEGDGSYSFIHTLTNEKFLVSKYLKELEEDLPKDNFFRLHKKYIINVAYVELLKKNKQQLTVVLKNEISLPVAFRRSVAFKKVIVGKF
jgi:two-component system, LytTR family, response regulator